MCVAMSVPHVLFAANPKTKVKVECRGREAGLKQPKLQKIEQPGDREGAATKEKTEQ